MITILAVGPSAPELAALAPRHPSVEILTAAELEEALEKLARNRRIDAVALLDGAAAGAIAEAIHEEDPASPPIFAEAPAAGIPGTRSLPAGSAEERLEFMVRALSAENKRGG